MKPIVWRPGEGEAVHLGTAASTSFKAEGPDTGSSLSITENVLAPGFPGPVPHTHRHTFDIFYVLEGTIAFQLGNASIEAHAGAFVLVPPGIVHAFRNSSGAAARFLNVQTPAGLEQYLKEVAAESHGGAPDASRMAPIASKYDFVAA